jgi:hypothetical protein
VSGTCCKAIVRIGLWHVVWLEKLGDTAREVRADQLAKFRAAESPSALAELPNISAPIPMIENFLIAVVWWVFICVSPYLNHRARVEV